MNYYERYMGDYQRDTGHLSLSEHGVYTVLLDTYYSTEKPLPPDIDRLYRLCRAMTKDEQSAVRTVADEFFPLGDDGLRHNYRADVEIEHARPKMEAARANGKKGGRPRKNANGETQNKPSGFFEETQQEPSNNPTETQGKPETKAPQPHTPTPKENNPHNPPAADAASTPDGFAEFWGAYPRHSGKANAEKAWVKLKPTEELQAQILASIAMQAKSRDWMKDGGQFIPHPATWLNGRRWEDETAKANAPSGVFAGVRVDNLEHA